MCLLCPISVVALKITVEFVELTEAEKTAAGGHFWPELLQSLWACAQSEAPDLREIALLILSEVPRVFEAQVERYVSIFPAVRRSRHTLSHWPRP